VLDLRLHIPFWAFLTRLSRAFFEGLLADSAGIYSRFPQHRQTKGPAAYPILAGIDVDFPLSVLRLLTHTLLWRERPLGIPFGQYCAGLIQRTA
jgi:hypothetical protein